MENETERQKAYGKFICAVQEALNTIPETAKENLEDLYSEYQGAVAASTITPMPWPTFSSAAGSSRAGTRDGGKMR